MDKAPGIPYIKAKYKRNKKINKFLTDVKQDVLKNVSYFLEEDKQAQNNQPQQGPMAKKQDPCLNYRVNLVVLIEIVDTIQENKLRLIK